ncbi:hypothetical protein DL96DRAFT_1579522 [Flagelloscypha sp. PMI_526]|nr:hypothetical protein DL96DRAFT_1579522 [Flagelloscypha sp. PMI_526]
MSSLPPELVGQILSSLDDSNLRSCSLVSKEFCALSQEFLFCHLHVCATSEALVDRCDFFLAEKNNRLCSRIRELSIDFDRFPDFERDTPIIDQFTKLLIKLGSQISVLRIEGEFYDTDVEEGSSIFWEKISPELRYCLYENIMPSLRILELPRVASVPVFQILRRSPLLRHIHLGSEAGIISPYLDGEGGDPFFHRGVVSLSIGPFGERDFRPDTELSRLIKYHERNITTFQLGLLSDGHFPPSLEFLLSVSRVHFPCHSFFHRATLSTGLDPLNVTIFRRLETFSCPMFFPYRASKWFNWIAMSLHPLVISHHTSAIPLKKLHFTVIPEDIVQRPIKGHSVVNELDYLAHNPYFSFSLEFSVTLSKGHEKVQSVFEGLREFFPSWDQMGRLKLWVEC